MYFVQGHGEQSTDAHRADRLQRRLPTSLDGDNFEDRTLVLAQQKAVPDRRVGAGRRRAEDRFLPGRDRHAQGVPRARAARCCSCSIRRERADAPPLTNLIALLKDWGIDVGTNIVVDVSGMGQLLGTDVSVPVAAQVPAASDHRTLQPADRLSARPIGQRRSRAAPTGTVAQNLVEHEHEQLGGDRHQAADARRVEVERELDKGDKAGPVSLAAAVSAPATDAPAPPPAIREANDDAPSPKRAWSSSATRISSSNGCLGIPGNRDLFLNTVNWLAQQENLISIRPQGPRGSRASADGATRRS